MTVTDDERRRYFRIEDTLGVTYEPLSDADARQKEIELKNPDPNNRGHLHQVERQLQLVTDKLRIRNPDFAEAIELLNIKFNTLKENQYADPNVQRRRSYIRRVNISACGISLDGNDRFGYGDKIYLELTLLPSDLHVFTLGEVVDCLPSDDPEWNYTIRIDFYGMTAADEELLVQHMVKRQARLLNEDRSR